MYKLPQSTFCHRGLKPDEIVKGSHSDQETVYRRLMTGHDSIACICSLQASGNQFSKFWRIGGDFHHNHPAMCRSIRQTVSTAELMATLHERNASSELVCQTTNCCFTASLLATMCRVLRCCSVTSCCRTVHDCPSFIGEASCHRNLLYDLISSLKAATVEDKQHRGAESGTYSYTSKGKYSVFRSTKADRLT